MSINLFKKFNSPNTVKKIYFYLYREINKKVARKLNEMMQLEIDRCTVYGRSIYLSGITNLNDVDTNVKDAYRMFKAVKKKQVRDRYTVKELRDMLGFNKVKGRSKLKTKQDMIVALMKI